MVGVECWFLVVLYCCGGIVDEYDFVGMDWGWGWVVVDCWIGGGVGCVCCEL